MVKKEKKKKVVPGILIFLIIAPDWFWEWRGTICKRFLEEMGWEAG